MALIFWLAGLVIFFVTHVNSRDTIVILILFSVACSLRNINGNLDTITEKLEGEDEEWDLLS